MKPFSLYLHIPYCHHKCPYCDFNTYAVSTIPEKEYTAALLAELDYYGSKEEWQGRPIQTVFFGGGTPSVFSPRSISKIIAAICRTFPIEDCAEISLEANPGSVTAENLAGYWEGGVNRLSIGAQSFNQETLRALGRVHSPNDIAASLSAADSVGYTNISLDLIYGAPGQTVGDLRGDLVEAMRFNPAHISAYGLTIEKGTPFFQSYKKGKLKLPSENHVLEMMNEIPHFLEHHKFERYEISNFAREGREAKHNMAYWNGDDYLGLGAGAHSYQNISEDNYGLRWSNFAAPDRYIEECTSNGKAESWRDTLSKTDAMFEFFFLGLRKMKGVSLSAFETRFKTTAKATYQSVFEVLETEKLIDTEGDTIKLSERGLMFADGVIENFVLEEAEKVTSPTTPKSDPPKIAVNQ